MDKAESKALEVYPVSIRKIPEPVKGGYMVIENDTNLAPRKCFIRGYHKAEQDNALTTNDVMKIIDIATNMCGIWMAVDCEEVLRRFNELKQKRDEMQRL